MKTSHEKSKISVLKPSKNNPPLIEKMLSRDNLQCGFGQRDGGGDNNDSNDSDTKHLTVAMAI